MKSIHILKVIAIIFYLLIILKGQLIGLPFAWWLIFNAFNYGHIDQLLSISGIIGVAINFTKWINLPWVSILSLGLLLAPLMGRMVQTPVHLFNYLAFQIPVAIFVLLYSYYIYLLLRKRIESPKNEDS